MRINKCQNSDFKKKIRYFIFFIGLLFIINFLSTSIRKSAKLFELQVATDTSDEFREQKISVENVETIKHADIEELTFSEGLALAMLANQFNLTQDLTKNDLEALVNYYFKLNKYRQSEWDTLVASYEMIWSDLKYFPIPDSTKNSKALVSFEDSWYYERSYGGERHHEGTDIMASVQERGYYPVLSMTDGTVEKMGWLKMGGYRIGIRSKHGGYFYYAHLESYAQNLKEGDSVQAGQLMGYMGDTGYSEVEGTTGKFPVHLHVGIYFTPDDNTELSVNPYWILKYLEKYKLKYSY